MDNGSENMSSVNVIPQSGIQLLSAVGAVFLIIGTRPDLGMFLLTLGVGVWLVYNLLNISRQF